MQRAIVGAAGPVAGLLLGVVAAVAYRDARHPAAGVPLLLLAAHGVSNFSGNLMSAAFVGDFSNAARALGVPMPLRYGIALLGMSGVVATLFVIVINEPTPMGASFASARWSEGAFWIVAAIGAFLATGRTTYELIPTKVLLIDAVVLVVTIGAVRLMSTGIAVAAFG